MWQCNFSYIKSIIYWDIYLLFWFNVDKFLLYEALLKGLIWYVYVLKSNIDSLKKSKDFKIEVSIQNKWSK